MINGMTAVAVIGSAGTVSGNVVKALIYSEFKVRVIVRNFQRARPMFPPQVELFEAIINDLESLINGLRDIDIVYISLAGTETQRSKSFHPEIEGIQNIVRAATICGVRQVIKIDGPGSISDRNGIKNQPGSSTIRQKGNLHFYNGNVPYTIFDCTVFMDAFFSNRSRYKIRTVGKPFPYYWIAAKDYARQVVKAIDNPLALFRHFTVQGIEQFTYLDLLSEVQKFYPRLKVYNIPMPVIRAIGLLSPEMKLLADLQEWAKTQENSNIALETWQILGIPEITLKEFARTLQLNDIQRAGY